MFDVHLHLSEDGGDVAAFFAGARAVGVRRFLLAGTSMEDCQKYVDVAHEEDGVYACVGLHPHVAQEFNVDSMGRFRKWLEDERVVAVGEIGLDYYYDFSPAEAQEAQFARFLELAAEVGKPVVIHCREAFAPCYELVKAHYDCSRPFLVHSFTGTLEEQEKWLELGAYISYNGMVTFKKADNVRQALAAMPMERLLLETDSPYLAPVPHRGEPNTPANIPLVAARIAEERNLAVEEVDRITTENALRLFQIENGPNPFWKNHL